MKKCTLVLGIGFAAIVLVFFPGSQLSAKHYCPPEGVLAFPTAEGFGALTRGGRYGNVLIVTNLKDYDPDTDKPIEGSLRKAIETVGPRIVIFRVSGTIELKTTLYITNSYITIAGQTAPGDGICLKNYGTGVRASEVIIRYMRFRPGDEIGRERKKKGKSFETDALSVEGYWVNGYVIGPDVHNIIFDHCSASWAIDEILSFACGGKTSPIRNVTVQWCIVSEALNNSFHHKGPHGFGSIIMGEGITFHHNIYAHLTYRGPLAESYPLDFRNNIIYNTVGGGWGDLNYVGNYLKRLRSDVALRLSGYDPFFPEKITQIHIADNYLEGGGERNKDNKKLVSGIKDENKMDEPFVAPAVRTDSAQEAYRKILESCGAVLPRRDEVDSRLIADIKTGRGEIIDSQQDLGGWPELKSTPAPKDSDNDGMPDDWEIKHGLNPKGSSKEPPNSDATWYPNDSARDADGDGYTNIEEYLNGTNPNVKDVSSPPVSSKL